MKYPSDTGMEVLGLFCGTSLGTFFEMLWSHILSDVSEKLFDDF